MRAFVKTLLVLEVVLCFGPMTLVLTMGALLLPIQVIVLVNESPIVGWRIVAAMPIVAGLHVLVLSRQLFFRSRG